MPVSIEIRRAKTGDNKRVYELVCQLENSTLNEKYLNDVFKRNLSSETVFYWVIETDKHVFGFISMHIQDLLHHEGRVAEVQELCVDENYRNNGFGKILLDHALTEAKKQNCELIEVAANRKREDAHRFYEKNGWERSHFKFTRKLK